jgi:formylglycine-generating enzyme required for sulfatase activity
LAEQDIYKTRKTEERPVFSAPALKQFSFDTVTLDEKGELAESRKGEAFYFMEDLGHCVGMEMVHVPAGEFIMGSDLYESGRRPNEGPQRRVPVPAFYIGKFPVSQEQWRTVADLPTVKMNLRHDPATFKGDTLPVDAIFWEEAVEFCDRLSAKTGRRYRLPSEAEWEYAARADSITPFAFGPTITSDLVNFNGNYPFAAAPKGAYREETTIVGQLGVANAFGLFDMHGNVWEWCQDEYHDNYHDAPTNASPWEGGGTGEKILRGGSWYCDSRMCRSAFRLRIPASSINNAVGFRVVVQ